MFNKVQNEFDENVRKIATTNVLKKLNEQDIQRSQVDNTKFNNLVDMEIDIIKSDGKKVGSGIIVGLGISLLTGGLF